jgi:hypothetical protein
MLLIWLEIGSKGKSTIMSKKTTLRRRETVPSWCDAA